ncbi:MAG: hypothetical protein VKJ02_13405 [Snowella sp.]|nr:hypothetical protein [Snowella sp.]
MAELETYVRMAEDELTQYSTEARKIEKLRRKIALALNYQQQQQLRDELLAVMPQGFFATLVENNRQSVALPFWGIAGLGLLFGISLQQPLDFMAPAIAIPLAITIQQWGWKLEAQRLVLKTLDELENRIKNPNTAT